MSDLTNLTPEELTSYPCEWDEDGVPSLIPSSKVITEVRRRLEDYEVLQETLRKSQRIEKEGIAAIASAADAEKRLEKCEAQLVCEKAQVLEINEWKNQADNERIAAQKRLHKYEAALKKVCMAVTNDNFWNVVDDVPLRNAIYFLFELLEWPKPEKFAYETLPLRLQRFVKGKRNDIKL